MLSCLLVEALQTETQSYSRTHYIKNDISDHKGLLTFALHIWY